MPRCRISGLLPFLPSCLPPSLSPLTAAPTPPSPLSHSTAPRVAQALRPHSASAPVPPRIPILYPATQRCTTHRPHLRLFTTHGALSHTRWKRLAPHTLTPSHPHTVSTLLTSTPRSPAQRPLTLTLSLTSTPRSPRSTPPPHRSAPSPRVLRAPLQVGAFGSSAAKPTTMPPRPSRHARRRWKLVLARAARLKRLAQIQAAPSPQR